ncbi:MAG TPA: hypothetical protein DIS90_13150 [Cytophagales bacterium]|nr:hypothetical protein [Cytophagales bacterium]
MGLLLQKHVLFLFLIVIHSSCLKEEASQSVFCTDPLFPFFCPSAGTCCSLPVYGKNLNKCYANLSECGSSGQSCESCAIEPNNTEAKNNFYTNWNCNGSSSCETSMGATSGTAGPFCDEATSKAWGDKFVPGKYSNDKSPTHTPTTGQPPNGKCFQTGDF